METFKIGNITIINDMFSVNTELPKNSVIMTDPPYNIGYGYNGYSDNIPDDEYHELISFKKYPLVMLHYPLAHYQVAFKRKQIPTKQVAWVYNSMNACQHRVITWWDIEPDFSLDGQQYKNLDDKRIKQRIENGETARLYDWWEIQQVKNVSHEKTEHPCQIPFSLMEKMVKITPTDNKIIVDPFTGSGTTALACLKLNREFIGYEQDATYFNIIKQRLTSQHQQETKLSTLFNL